MSAPAHPPQLLCYPSCATLYQIHSATLSLTPSLPSPWWVM